MNKARLGTLAKQIKSADKPEKEEDAAMGAKRGEREDYVKLSVTLPPAVYELVMKEVTRRKVAKEKGLEPAISAVLREAVVEYLSGK